MKHAVYRNFLFIHYGARQASLETYLGQAKDYIDLICDQSGGGTGDHSRRLRAFDQGQLEAAQRKTAWTPTTAAVRPQALPEYLNSLGTDPESH